MTIKTISPSRFHILLNAVGAASTTEPRLHSESQADLTDVQGKRLRVAVDNGTGEIVAYRPDGPGIHLRTTDIGVAISHIMARLADKRTAKKATADFVRFDRIATQANKDARYMIVNNYDYRGRPTNWDRVDRLIAREGAYAEKRDVAAVRMSDLGAW